MMSRAFYTEQMNIFYPLNSLVEPVLSCGGGGYNPLYTSFLDEFSCCHPELDSGSIKFVISKQTNSIYPSGGRVCCQ